MGSLNDTLAEGLSELSRFPEPSRLQLDALEELSLLLESWASRINLTGHKTARQIVERLILDAAALLSALPPFESLVDLGSGAGFPGLPIAILEPERSVTLVEARLKRNHFQRAAVRQLALRNVSLARGRSEDIPPTPGDLVVAQAMGPRERVIDWMLPWARLGGTLALPGGAEAPSELANPALGEVRTVEYRVPLGGARRTLWLAEKRTSPL